MEAPTLTSNQQVNLYRVQVRPILPTERERWNTLMQAHHYRGFRTMAGRTLRYVATLDWPSVAKCSKARDPGRRVPGPSPQRFPAWPGGDHRTKRNRPENQRNFGNAQPAQRRRHPRQGRDRRCFAYPAGNGSIPRRRPKSRLPLHRRQKQPAKTSQPSGMPPLGGFSPSALTPPMSPMAVLNTVKSPSPPRRPASTSPIWVGPS